MALSDKPATDLNLEKDRIMQLLNAWNRAVSEKRWAAAESLSNDVVTQAMRLRRATIVAREAE